MTVCQSATVVKQSGGARILATLRCRSWGCPDCQPQRRKQLIAIGLRGNPGTFLTITHRPRDGETKGEAAATLARAWRLLRLRIMRKFKLERLPFLAVIERHTSGWPHLHILTRMPYVPHGWISDQMQDIDGSPIVHITTIKKRASIAGYVAKYVGKDPARIGTTKRYWQSRDFQLSRWERKSELRPGERLWEIEWRPLYQVVKSYAELGCLIAWDDQGRARVEAPPGWTGSW